MDLRHLRAFVTVADAQGFARAAARLNLSQPALSRRIHALEQELGIRLFDRAGRNVRLTGRGADLLVRCRRVLADFAADKPAGSPCLHLADDDRCGIHDRLRPAGYAGCTVYDCLGAGQRLTHGAGEERSWRGASATAAGLFRSLPLLQGVLELLALLDETAGLTAGSGSARTVVELRFRADALAAQISRVAFDRFSV
jgi:hypothetical protein